MRQQDPQEEVLMHLLAVPAARMVERFELTTRDGRTYWYPPPTWRDRLATWLHSVAEPTVVSAIVLGIIFFAGAIAEAIEPLASDPCRNVGRTSYKPIV
jgi:hypothetical protein